MENTLLVALSRQMSLERQIDVIANNVANTNTNGFKANKPIFEEYLNTSAREENFTSSDRRISFVQDRTAYHDFSQGPLEKTSNPLDVSIDGKAFFTIQTPGGERYTRDGSFQINSQGQLVTNSGNIVLGTNGPIVFQPTDRNIKISSEGLITVNEGIVTQFDSIRGRLRLSKFDDLQRLNKEGGNLYSAPAGVGAQADTTTHVNQGFIEKSNVSAVAEMTKMMEVMRTYQSVASLMQQQNDLRKNAIQTLADVPA